MYILFFGWVICLRILSGNDFGGHDVYYLLYIHYSQLSAGKTTEGRLGLRFGIWCTVKLDLYGILCSTSLILVGANGITNLGSKLSPGAE